MYSKQTRQKMYFRNLYVQLVRRSVVDIQINDLKNVNIKIVDIKMHVDITY
jgi:hypothetical protein